MINKVLQTIKENNMFQRSDKVIVAVSGGPDSMCLLHLLHELQEQLGITLAAAHLNHCLRGEEADLDEQYVREFCTKNKIDFYSERVDIHRISKENNISCEMAGREARYVFFEKLMKVVNAQKVALAHNSNDQTETVLMRIMRGTGIEGLAGIRPVRDGIFVRPIINITRAQIEKYCEVNKINARIDKTNLENIFTRNKIRLELIPYIEKNFNKDIMKTINRLADTVKKDNDYIENISLNKYKKYCELKGEKVIINKDAFNEHEALLSRIIRKALINLTGSLYNYEKIHIYNIINLQKQGTGKRIMLPNGILATNNYADIHLFIDNKTNDIVENKEYILQINEHNIIKEKGVSFQLSLVKKNTYLNLKKKNLTKYFDYDKIKGDIIFRYRKNGDRIVPLGMKGSKKLKKIFIDLKIPTEEREEIPIICFGDDIAWIVGYKVSEKFKIDGDSKNILEIKFGREE